MLCSIIVCVSCTDGFGGAATAHATAGQRDPHHAERYGPYPTREHNSGQPIIVQTGLFVTGQPIIVQTSLFVNIQDYGILSASQRISATSLLTIYNQAGAHFYIFYKNTACLTVENPLCMIKSYHHSSRIYTYTFMWSLKITTLAYIHVQTGISGRAPPSYCLYGNSEPFCAPVALLMALETAAGKRLTCLLSCAGVVYVHATINIKMV